MNGCIFCKIIKGEVPSKKVYEGERILAFLDTNPATRGHTLVVPKAHASDIIDLNDEDAKAILVVAKNISVAMLHGLKAQGINLINSNKKAAGQVVFHYHMHVIPRYEGDGINFFPEKHYTDENLDETAQKIKHSL